MAEHTRRMAKRSRIVREVMAVKEGAEDIQNAEREYQEEVMRAWAAKAVLTTGADGTAGATSELSDEYILRSCVVDLSLDYCTRVSTRVTTDYLDGLEKIPEAEYPKLSDLDALLANRTDEVEPYCTAFTWSLFT